MQRKEFINKKGEVFSYLSLESSKAHTTLIFYHATGFNAETYKILLLLIPILVSVALIVWFDRRVWGFVQKRKGPNVVGFLGLLQPLADGLKLLLKETVIPTNASTFSFVFAPVLTLFLSLFG